MATCKQREMHADTRDSRFLPNAGKYMLNVLEGKSNGAEKDRAFAWKPRTELEGEQRRSAGRREWRDLQDDTNLSVSAKL